jgi:hypothetical protein
MERHFDNAELNPDLTPLLAEAGVSLEQIMDRLGLTNDQITKNILSPRYARNEKRSLSKVFNK